MAYANAHVKVTIFGDTFGGAEEWSTGFHMGTTAEGGGNFAVNADWVNTLASAWQTFFSANGSGSPQYARTLGVKAGVVLPTGRFDLGTIIPRTYATPVAGGHPGTVYPAQCTLVASLETANRRDLGGKGRMYLPTNFGVNGGGHINAVDAQACADLLRTFFDTIEDAAGSPGYVIIASQGRNPTNGSASAPPVNRRVTNVRVGDVIDTQRRRRNQLTETYYNATLSAAP